MKKEDERYVGSLQGGLHVTIIFTAKSNVDIETLKKKSDSFQDLAESSSVDIESTTRKLSVKVVDKMITIDIGYSTCSPHQQWNDLAISDAKKLIRLFESLVEHIN